MREIGIATGIDAGDFSRVLARLESAALITRVMKLAALDPTDTRSIDVRVAGPAAIQLRKFIK